MARRRRAAAPAPAVDPSIAGSDQSAEEVEQAQEEELPEAPEPLEEEGARLARVLVHAQACPAAPAVLLI